MQSLSELYFSKKIWADQISFFEVNTAFITIITVVIV